jgi:hypothetical protein
VPATTSRQIRGASKVVRQLSTNTAHLIRRKFEIEHDQQPTNANLPSSSQDYISGNNPEKCVDSSDDDDDDEDDLDNDISEEKVLPSDLECILLETRAFEMLQDNLRLFLNPDPVERAVFESWPVIKSTSESVAIDYHIQWELLQFLDSEHANLQDLGKLLTVTGGSENAQALSCEDYITATWPSMGQFLLSTVQKFGYGEEDGESPFLFVLDYVM